ncbi:MAG: undecaprenyl diphosphate synthase family protein, partial [Planctomycetaceae bacterium]|nr:undecaprenyl diphosphate synthase family protein [Planctomycetaceae bacterium]
LWVTQKFWPDFRAPDLIEAFRDFGQRERRFGGLIQK